MLDVYWLLFNPFIHDLLNIVFGIVLVIGVGLLILNLVTLAFSYRRTGPLIGIAVSLLLIGISVRWDWFIPTISEIMGGITQYLGYYLYLLVQQWLAQNTPPIVLTIPL